MTRWIAGRLLQALVVVLLVTTVSFVLVHLAPGDPFSIDDPRVPEATRERLRTQYGLDRPIGEQYVRWLSSAARGELGWSFSRRAPVATVMREALPCPRLATNRSRKLTASDSNANAPSLAIDGLRTRVPLATTLRSPVVGWTSTSDSLCRSSSPSA